MLEEIANIDRKEEDGVSSIEDFAKQVSLKFEVANRIQMEEISWKKKARARWVEERDRNTKFFHC